jgi:ELWxxDGT repeat protein
MQPIDKIPGLRSLASAVTGLFLAGTSLFAQPTLVKDINTATRQVNDYTGPLDVVNLNGVLYFAADNGTTGGELFKSNGTAPGTMLIKDLNPGTQGSDPADFALLNGTVYFAATDALGGRELYKTDGTAAGTVRVKDINPGAGSASPADLVVLNGVLYFSADEGTGGRELWKSNGTATGTVRVKDVYPGATGSNPQFLTVLNSALYFAADDGALGRELWKSNGTATGTTLVKDINPGSKSASPAGLTTVNNVLYFSADDDNKGTELWRSNGTAAGTTLVADLETGSYLGQEYGYVTSSNPQHLTNVNGTLFFSAFTAQYGEELWKSDGTAAGTVLVADIDPQGYLSWERVEYEWKEIFIPNSSDPRELTTVNGTLYLSATVNVMENGSTYSGIWKSAGAEATLVKKMENTAGYVNLNGTLYFRTPGSTSDELWKSNGTEAGTVPVKSIGHPFKLTEGSSPANLTYVNGTLYFSALDATSGRELWKSNGAAAGTSRVKDIVPGAGSSLDPSGTTSAGLNGTLYFTVTTNFAQYALWKSDGTDAGTVKVSDIGGRATMAAVNGALYFTNDKGLWRSNGTAAGTVLLKGGAAEYLLNVNGTLYFVLDDGTSGGEIWRSNGTAAGTTRLKDINPGLGSSYPRELTNVNGTLFFRAYSSSEVFVPSLWKSNGTEAGTVKVKSAISGDAGAFTAVGNLLYYVDEDATYGREIWKSDGTPAGTVLVKDINPGPAGSYPFNLASAKGALYFAFNNGDNLGLWRSNGTAAGTIKVKGGVVPDKIIEVNNTLYFAGYESDGFDLWRSDGTAAGTFSLRDVDTGARLWIENYSPYFTNANGVLYLAADNRITGNELWKYDATGCINPVASLTVLGSTVCANSPGSVTVKASEAGVTYRVHYGNSAVGQSVKSPGGDITLTLPAVHLSAGANVFTVKAFGCVQTTLTQTATVTVRPALVAPAAGGATIQSGQTATLTASGAPSGAVYRWYSAATGGTLLFTGATYQTPALTATTPYYAAVYLTPCGESSRTKVTVTVNPAAVGSFRVNAGGNAFSTIDARPFTADAYFSGGTVSTATTLGIGGTADDYLYQTGRHGASFTYNFPTGNGSYDVVLHFAETYFGNTAPGGMGSRKFHVNAEGVRKLTDYDVFARAGGALKVAQETFRVTVSDGTLNLAFLKGTADNPAVKAIEVLPAGSALAINSGGGVFTTGAGKRYSSDVYYASGSASSIASGEVSGTTDDGLYRNARVGVFSYGIPTGSGTFTVVLHFNETWFGYRTTGGAGSRKFNVYAEGVKRLSDFDIFATAGGAMRAVTQTMQVTVSDGILNLYFAKGLADNPIVSAVEVLPASGARLAGEPAAEAGEVRLYPNPATDKFTVKLPFSAHQVQSTAVSDGSGRIVLRDAHRQTSEDELEIRVESLPEGFYLLQLRTDDGGSRMVRFLKQ